MGKKNRVEATIQVDTKIVPTVTNAVHRDLLKNDIVNGVVFEKDVIATETVVAGSVTIDYSNKDTATVNTSVNLTVSFTNIENGSVKYLSVTKSTTNTVSFAGAVDVSPRRAYINSSSTVVIYKISHKNGSIYVSAINIDFDFQPEINALSSYLVNYVNNIVAATLNGIEFKYLNIGAWNMTGFAVTSVSYVVPAGKKIINIHATIVNDTGLGIYQLNTIVEGNTNVGGYIIYNNAFSKRFELRTNNLGFFNTGVFSSLASNRGVITFQLIDV